MMKIKTFLIRVVSVCLCLVMALLLSSCEMLVPGSSIIFGDDAIIGGNILSEDESVQYKVVSESYKVHTDSIGSVYMECCIVIENTGKENIYIHDTDIDIEDDSGSLIDTKSGLEAYPDVIAPGEKSIIYDSVLLDENPSDGCTVKPFFSIEEATVPIERLEVFDVSIKEYYTHYVKTVGRVKNTTDESQSLYTLVVVFYDENDNIIGLTYTYPDSLEPGETTSFSTTNMFDSQDIEFSDIDHYDAFAFTLQYQF